MATIIQPLYMRQNYSAPVGHGTAYAPNAAKTRRAACGAMRRMRRDAPRSGAILVGLLWPFVSTCGRHVPHSGAAPRAAQTRRAASGVMRRMRRDAPHSGAILVGLACSVALRFNMWAPCAAAPQTTIETDGLSHGGV